MRIGRVEFNKTPYCFDFAINAKGLRQHFAAWYLRRCDYGFYVFGKHFVWSLAVSPACPELSAPESPPLPQITAAQIEALPSAVLRVEQPLSIFSVPLSEIGIPAVRRWLSPLPAEPSRSSGDAK